MKAIQFGAGNIGRGFIGALLQQSGYELIFADVIEDVIKQINQKHQYTVHVTDVESCDIVIDGVSAINSMSDEIIPAIVETDLITTAVGVGILPRIAPTIANGIVARKQANNENPLNIIACENAVLATSVLKEAVYEKLKDEEKLFADKYIGFANCSVDRIVPPVSEASGIDVAVEKYFEWNVCKSELVSDLDVKGVNLVDKLEAYVERKLFTLNTGHAITAYLGFLKGKNTIEDAINTDEIYNVVKSAMQESGNGLIKKYCFDKDAHYAYIDKIIWRFKNPYLKDDVARVGREPLRKLSIEDRLVKPMLTAYGYDFEVDNLLIGIAAALHFNNPEDPQSVEMQEKISKYGLHDAIADVTGIADKNLIDRIEKNYYELLEK